MNRTKNLVSSVLVVALLLSVNSAIAQTPVDSDGREIMPRGTVSVSLGGPKKLPSPTDQITAEKVKIRAENPIWSPLGDKIAFIRVVDDIYIHDPNARQLCTIEVNSDKPEAIASVSTLPKNFCWSPDGKKIAFVEAGAKDCDIYTIDLASKTRVKITDCKEHTSYSDYCYLSWSPDGTKIAFSVKRRNGDPQTRFQTWIADAQGKFWFKLTGGFNPVWFPDSKRIVFANGIPGQCVFFVIDIDGKNLKQVKDPGGAFGTLQDIYISPDSKFILCHSDTFLSIIKPNEDQPTLMTIFGDTTGEMPVILGLNDQTVAVVRNGTVQLFDRKKLTSVKTSEHYAPIPKGVTISQFKVPNLSTEDEKETFWGGYLHRPIWSWSPNNKEVAFVGKDNEIWKMNTNGTNQKQLTFERTRLVQLAQQEQEKAQASAREKFETGLKN